MEAIKNLFRVFVPRPVINTYHWCGALLANLIFWFPGRNLRVFAVTGTNGKTTTSLLLYSILKAARRKVGLATTVRFSDGAQLWRNDTKLGTQNPFRLAQLLRRMVRNSATEAVLEVTSIGLDQHRIWGIPIDTAILCNFTPDHLEYHHTKEAYRQTKERLFAVEHRVSVVNGDDPVARFFLQYPAVRKLRYSTANREVEVWASEIRVTAKGTKFILHLRQGSGGQVHSSQEQATVELKLIGRFNVENALAAAAAAAGANIPLETIIAGLQDLAVSPGRMELLDYGQPYVVVLDYAHTPDGLRKVFETLKPLTKGRLIHVGGATGRRYPEKRPLLGALSGRFADVVIVTDEDPYNEDPSAIIQQVVSGVKKGAGRQPLEHGKNFFTILDRAEAIRQALKLARPNDVVLITGKGDETIMATRSGMVQFSDRHVVEKALRG